jgi:HAD superfamily hydrolase (TIGR01490 family)
MEHAMKQSAIAAFFDIDGTLLPGPSLEWRLVAHLARRLVLRPAAIGNWMGVFLAEYSSALWRRNIMPVRLAAVDRNKLYLAGARESILEEWAANHLESLATDEFFPGALAKIAWHRERGHRVFLVSGTLTPLARAIGARLADGGEIEVVATKLEIAGGILTGNIAGDAICGPAKACAMVRAAARYDLDLTRSYAYGNSSTDRWMLAAAGHAVAVNPCAALVRLARRCGWRIAQWSTAGDSTRNISDQRFTLEDKLIWR